MKKDDIRLVSIEEVSHPQGNAWRVTLGYFPSPSAPPRLTSFWDFHPSQYEDEDIIDVARAYFHSTCKAIVGLTEDWALSTQDIADRRKDAKTRSADTQSG